MNISVSKHAIEWMARELHMPDGDGVRFFVRYGDSHIHPGFNLTVGVAKPLHPAISWVQEGILLFIEQGDVWYLEGYDLAVHYDDVHDDLQFAYTVSSSKSTER